MPRWIDIKGQRFGRLVAVEMIGKSKTNQALWRCYCDCGKEHITIASHLIRGITKSCGCLNRFLASQRMAKLATKHGMEGTGTYKTWKDMKKRCYQESFKDFHLYGGRGIVVCERWRVDFLAFYIDMGEKPRGLTLDRIDPNGIYSKENCRWATPSRQARNTRRNRLIEYKGVKMCAADWGDILGVKGPTISMRKLRGWTDEEAVTGVRRCTDR